MKRMHISLATADVEKSKAFYSALFGTEPTMDRDGYVQWMLDDPRVNFVIEEGCGEPGLSHLGVQAEDEAELDHQFARVAKAGGPVWNQGETQCCFAESDKNWTKDPDGISWETFHTHRRTGDYGDHVDLSQIEAEVAEAKVEPEDQKYSCC
ncbi:MAG: ArsI/CadI family heavy metal resistance metalloenzyme [Pseudomonadota bacterium]